MSTANGSVRAVAAPRAPAPSLRALPEQARRWCLFAVVAVSATTPWYTLRLFPVVTAGAAKINVEDALVACATALAIFPIIHAVRTGSPASRWIVVFIAYMVAPFLIGLREPASAFYAIREARALAFYVVALAFVTVGFTPRDFRNAAAIYVSSACIAALAVMAHQRGLIVLPGYPVERALQVRYLDWTVPLVAFTIGLTGALGAGTLRDRLLWACSLPLLVWYLVSMQERTTQGIAAVITVIVLSIPRFGGLTVRRLAGLAAVSGLVVVLQGSFVPAPASITLPLHQMLMRWSQALTDGSLAVRLAELRSGMVRLTDDPLFGIGLGTIVSDTAPPGALGPWRYVSTGYGFLLIRTGIIGLSLFAGMTSTAIVSAIRRLRAAPDERAWPSVSIGLTGLGALLALNLNYPALDVPEGVIAFGLFYGMIASHRALRKERPGLPANGEPR